MIGVMDSNLRHISDSIGARFDDGCEFEFDIDFRYVPDVIEENAINEKSCMEVLNRMIAKADAEICDLEDDLAILQSQLCWAENAEHDKLYEVWCGAFREKITSLSSSLQNLRKGYAPNNSTLNADSGVHHEPVERIHNIVSVLLEHNIPMESKKECVILNADVEVPENTTTVSTSLDLSRKPDNKQITGTENQVSDNDIKGESFALQGAKSVEGTETIILSHQDSAGKGEIEEPTLRKSLLPSVLKVEFNENAPLAMMLTSQGSKRKKLQSWSARSSTEVLEEMNQKLSMDDTSDSSEGNGRKFGVCRSSVEEKPTLHANADSNQNASQVRYQVALTSEIKDSSTSSHSRDLKGGTKDSPLEKHKEETTVSSDRTRKKLEKMNRAELVATAKSHGLKGYHKMKKSLIVDMIMGTLD